jgi:hypothetical protein
MTLPGSTTPQTGQDLPGQNPPGSAGAGTGAGAGDFNAENIEALVASVTADPRRAAQTIKELRQESERRRKEAQNATRAQSEEATAHAATVTRETQLRAELEQIRKERDDLKAVSGAFETSVQARLKAIPETKRGLVPEGMPPLQLSAWLDKNAQALSLPVAPGLDAGAGSGSQPPPGGSGGALGKISETERKVAAEMGLTPEKYVEMRKKLGLENQVQIAYVEPKEADK